MDSEIHKLLQGYFGLSPEKSNALLELFIDKTITKQDFFFRKHKRTVPLAFIKSGYLRIYDIQNGKEVTQWISGPGDLVTDIGGLFFDLPNRWNAVALTDITLAYMPNSSYKNIGNEIPEWPLLEKQFIAKCFRILEERVFTFISMTAKERYNVFMDEKAELMNHIPLQYIASMLGMTPETLSRIRAAK